MAAKNHANGETLTAIPLAIRLKGNPVPSLLSPKRGDTNLYEQHIYIIENCVNGMKYYGRTNNPRNRKNWHFSHLRRNIHGNDKLQKSFNKYGEDNFSFRVIEKIAGDDKDELLELIMKIEQGYLDLPEEKFNLSKSSRTPSNYIFHGKDNPFYGKKHTKKSKELQRLAKLGMYDGKNNPFYGKSHTKENKKIFAETAKKTFSGVPKSKEQRAKMRLSSKKRIPVLIDGVKYASLREASELTGECRKLISLKVKSGEYTNYQYANKDRITSDKRKV